MAKKKAAPEEEEYHVEVILEARVLDDIEGLDDGMAWEYLVKWYGYDNEDDNTWEPHENICVTCDRLLTSFWDEIGMDKEDYPQAGYTVRPSEDWLKKEKKYFRRILKEPDETPPRQLDGEESSNSMFDDGQLDGQESQGVTFDVGQLGLDVPTHGENSHSSHFRAPPWSELRPFGLHPPRYLSLTDWATRAVIPLPTQQKLSALHIEGPHNLRGWGHSHLLAIGLSHVEAAIVCDSLDRWENHAYS